MKQSGFKPIPECVSINHHKGDSEIVCFITLSENYYVGNVELTLSENYYVGNVELVHSINYLPCFK